MVKKIGLILFGIALPLLLLEFSLRFYVANFGSDDQKVLYYYNREQIEAVGRRFEGAAYLNFMLSPVRAEHNSLGYRGDEITQPKPAATYRIVALGGSTTYGEFINDNNATYPAQLQARLHAEGYESVEIINAGVPAYTSWDSLVNLQFRVLDLEPDLIIIYHAVNDINPRLTDPASYDSRNSARGYWRGDEDTLPISSLYRFVAVRLGWEPPVAVKIENQFVQPDGYQGCGLEFRDEIAYCANYDMPAQAVMDANEPIYFERNMRNMVLLAQGNDVDVLLASWAYSPIGFAVPGGDFMTEPYRQNAVAEHNAIIAELADELTAPFFDFAALMPTDAAYWIDGLHVSEAGASLQAELFTAFIMENNLLEN